MNAAEIKSAARANTVAYLTDVLNAHDAVQFGEASWAILQEVDGQEVWCEVTVKTKAYKATKVTPVFDPFEVAEVWKAEKAQKEAEKAQKEVEKARKTEEKKKKAE